MVCSHEQLGRVQVGTARRAHGTGGDAVAAEPRNLPRSQRVWSSSATDAHQRRSGQGLLWAQGEPQTGEIQKGGLSVSGASLPSGIPSVVYM